MSLADWYGMAGVRRTEHAVPSASGDERRPSSSAGHFIEKLPTGHFHLGLPIPLSRIRSRLFCRECINFFILNIISWHQNLIFIAFFLFICVVVVGQAAPQWTSESSYEVFFSTKFNDELIRLLVSIWKDCNFLLTDSQGELSSPNHPTTSYEDNLNCRWLITVPSNLKVSLVFDR